jgi:hypothetical protein
MTQKHSEHISIRLPYATKVKLLKLAEGVGTSELIRSLIERASRRNRSSIASKRGIHVDP